MCLSDKSPMHRSYPAPIRIEGTKRPNEMGIPHVQQAISQYKLVNIPNVIKLNSLTLP